MQLPFSYPSNILEYGYRALSSINVDKSNANKYKVKYSMMDGSNGTIEMFNPQLSHLNQGMFTHITYESSPMKLRNNILKALFSNKAYLVNEAEYLINYLYQQYKQANLSGNQQQTMPGTNQTNP